MHVIIERDEHGNPTLGLTTTWQQVSGEYIIVGGLAGDSQSEDLRLVAARMTPVDAETALQELLEPLLEFCGTDDPDSVLAEPITWAVARRFDSGIQVDGQGPAVLVAASFFSLFDNEKVPVDAQVGELAAAS